jgi:Uma2 family endonuclease
VAPLRYADGVTASATVLDHDERRPQEDHFVRLHGASWSDYQRVLELRGDHSAPRITFLEGELEIMNPSRHHESKESIIGRLVEVYCLEKGIEFSTYGSWTIESEESQRGAEPDECYVFGEVDEPQRPDLAIEVVWTSGGIDKLEVYRKLGVREVWYWRRGKLHAFVLRGEQYVPLERSEVLSGIDLDLLATFLHRKTTSEAIRAYQAALRAT